jgi:hypothetical protein
VSTLMVGVRSAAGHLSGRPIAADTGMAIDTSPATCAGHQPSGRRSFQKQRTVNPLMVPARYNFLYSSFQGRPRTAAAGGRPRPAIPDEPNSGFDNLPTAE